MTFQIGYITPYSVGGFTSVAELLIQEQMNSKKGHENSKPLVIHTSNYELPVHLAEIKGIGRLYITDLVVPSTIDVSKELVRIANENKPKTQRPRKDMITIITDNEIPPDISKIRGVEVHSPDWIGNHNKSTSQIVYGYVQRTTGQIPDTRCNSLANLGAAKRFPKAPFYYPTIEEAKELNYAIIENRENRTSLDEILFELTRNGSIGNDAIKERIKTDSETFETKIDKAYETIIKGTIYEDDDYIISRINNNKLPIDRATSQIQQGERKNVFVITDNGDHIDTSMIMRVDDEGSLDSMLKTLKEHNIYAKRPYTDGPTRYFTLNDPTDVITQKITDFCSNPLVS